jgi:hypothetical protein
VGSAVRATRPAPRFRDGTDGRRAAAGWQPGGPPKPSGGGKAALIAGLATVLVLLLGVGAFFLVRQLSSTSDSGSSVAAEDGDSGGAAASLPGGAQSDTPDAGPLQPVSVTASCQAPPGVDSVGNTITYEPELVLDATPETAWRCPGSAVRQTLTFDFGHEVTVTSVGLVPGYAKVDPADGTDRFAENRTVTSVVWRFSGGRSVRQDIRTPEPTMLSVDVPGVTARYVVLEIAGTGNDGAIRDFTAISDVHFEGS